MNEVAGMELGRESRRGKCKVMPYKHVFGCRKSGKAILSMAEG
jgi:hypothetical protein